MRTRFDGGDTLVEINLDGGAAPAMVIRLNGRVALTSGDFILGSR